MCGFPLLCLAGSDSSSHEKQEKSVASAIQSGLGYLLKNQLAEGGWDTPKILQKAGGCFGTVNGVAMLAIKFNLKENTEKNLSTAFDKARDNLLKFKPKGEHFKSSDYRHLENTFVFLSLAYIYRETKDEAIKGKLKEIVDALVSGQEEQGGWTYYGIKPKIDKQYDERLPKDAIKIEQFPFMTGAIVISLLEAKGIGIDVPEDTIKKGVEFLNATRYGDKGFRYALTTNGEGTSNTPHGSCARAVACELALFLAGSSSKEKLAAAVNNFFEFRDKLEIGRKKGAEGKDGKTSGHDFKNGAICSYYFFFGHFFALQALHILDKDTKIQVGKDGKKGITDAIEALKAAMVEIQDDKYGGSWLDSGYTGRNYATAMALVILSGEKILTKGTK